nr:hypothetical protein GCM10025732_29700 [Glycomyces mayteni]
MRWCGSLRTTGPHRRGHPGPDGDRGAAFARPRDRVHLLRRKVFGGEIPVEQEAPVPVVDPGPVGVLVRTDGLRCRSGSWRPGAGVPVDRQAGEHDETAHDRVEAHRPVR